MRIYFAQVMDNVAYLERTISILNELEAAGHSVYFPWRDEGVILESDELEETQYKTFNNDVSNLRDCDVVIGYIDGLGPDSGTCVELGMAYILNKPIALYTTEFKFMPQGTNIEEVLKPYDKYITFAGEGSKILDVKPMMNNMLFGVSKGTVFTNSSDILEWLNTLKE